MKVILKQDVPNLGDLGDELEVKSGYARNFLLPQGLVIHANLSNQKWAARLKQQILLKRKQLLADLQVIANKIEGLQLEFTAKAGKSGKLFGSITTKQITEALEQQGLSLSRRQLQNLEPLKQLGEHSIKLNFHTECIATLHIKVVELQPEPESEPAETAEQPEGEVAPPAVEASSEDQTEIEKPASN